MKLNYSGKQDAVNIPIIFAIITLLAFLPFTSMIFALKNDAFTGYFPPKFFMSESIHSGYFPLWNPYINYGLPQYGDMSSGFWSPITWLIASTIGYNAYTFTLEEVLYIFLAGTGMFYLTRALKVDKRISILAGTCYMCSGYIVGHLQHFNWISGAAFLPWCITAYLNLCLKIKWISVFKAGIFFLLFVSSAHPGLLIGGIYFFAFLASAFWYNQYRKQTSLSTLFKKTFLVNGSIILILIFFCIGPIIGYSEIIPFINRGSKLVSAGSIGEATTLQSWISLLIPFATTKNDSFFLNDIALRNCYIGLLLLVFFITAIVNKKTNWQKLLFLIFIFFFLLSLDGVIKNFFYNYLPLFGYVRLNGEFRIYAILSAILIAAIELNKLSKSKSNVYKKVFYVITSLLIITLIYSLLNVTGKEFFLFRLHNLSFTRSALKEFIDNLTFNDTLFIQTAIQLIILFWLYKVRLKFPTGIWINIGIAEIILSALLNIPFTGVGKISTQQIQNLLNKSPKGIPIPSLQPTVKNDTMSPLVTKQVGDWSFYNKQIGSVKEVPYPIRLNTTINFFKSNEVKKSNSQNFIYFSHPNPGDTINIISFTPNSIKLRTQSGSDQICTIKQNFYPHWHCFVNGNTTQVNKSSLTFISFQVHPGNNKILVEFKNSKIKILVFWTLAVFLIASIGILIINGKKQQ